MSGARLAGSVDTLKVIAFVQTGEVVCDSEIGYSGTGADHRARLAAEILDLRLQKLGITRYRLDYVGINSLGEHSGVIPSGPSGK